MSEERPIPFNTWTDVGRERDYVQQAISSRHLHGDGEFTRRASEWLERKTGASKALMTTSCTHALEMSALLLDLGPGDEVIVPSFTFVSTATAFALRGAEIVFGDVHPDTLCLSLESIEKNLSAKTKAIVVVHYGGIGSELEEIAAFAKAKGVALIEDNAHGLCGDYAGKPLGSWGALATQSFHDTKNFSAGEGGALLINDDSLIPRAEIIREKGTNRSQFVQGLVDKYSWVDIGSSYLPSELNMAHLLGHFEEAEAIQAKRKLQWSEYRRRLSFLEERGGALPCVPQKSGPAYHLFHVILPKSVERGAFIAFMRERKITTPFHYVPLHESTYARARQFRGDCPITADISARLVRLPLFFSLDDVDVERVVNAVEAFFERN